MAVDVAGVLRIVLDEYTLPLRGLHGVAHWARVLENGLRLAGETGADVEVVRLFAVLHDSRRVDEGADFGHGPRAAMFATKLRGRAFDLPDPAFALLKRAIANHTDEQTDPDVTVRTCFDADRLDLGRVGITPDPEWLGTEPARRPDTIAWAHGRATLGFVPDLVERDWGLVL